MARSFLPPDRDVAIFGRAWNYFISYYDRSAAKWGLWLTGKSGRKTANVCDASTREININTTATFMLVAFIKINRLSSFFSEICRSKFSKLFVFLLFVIVSKITFPLAMNVATLEKPSDSKTRRNDCILTVRPRPTLIARRKAKNLDTAKMLILKTAA